MAGMTIKHNFENSEEAVKELVRLSAKLNALQIDHNLSRTQGKTRGKIDEAITELKATHKILDEIISKTREVLKNASPTFAQADAEAAAQFEGTQ